MEGSVLQSHPYTPALQAGENSFHPGQVLLL